MHINIIIIKRRGGRRVKKPSGRFGLWTVYSPNTINIYIYIKKYTRKRGGDVLLLANKAVCASGRGEVLTILKSARIICPRPIFFFLLPFSLPGFFFLSFIIYRLKLFKERKRPVSPGWYYGGLVFNYNVYINPFPPPYAWLYYIYIYTYGFRWNREIYILYRAAAAAAYIHVDRRRTRFPKTIRGIRFYENSGKGPVGGQHHGGTARAGVAHLNIYF